MPYKKTTWKNHETKLNETNLNNMEEGIATANQKAEANEDNITEIRNASQKVSVSFDNANKDLVIKVGDDSTPNVKSEHRTNIPVMSQDELFEKFGEYDTQIKQYIANKVTGFYKPIGSVPTVEDLPNAAKARSVLGDMTNLLKRHQEEHTLDIKDEVIYIYQNNYFKGPNLRNIPALTNENLLSNTLDDELELGDKVFIIVKIENKPASIDINSLSLSAPESVSIVSTENFEDKYLIASVTKTSRRIKINIPYILIRCTRQITEEEFDSMDISLSIIKAKDLKVQETSEVYSEYLVWLDVYSTKFFNGESFYLDESIREELESYQIGDTLNVVSTNMNYTWNGEEWDPLGSEPIQILSTMYSNISKDNLPPDGLYLAKEKVYIYYDYNSFNSCQANSLLFVKGKVINVLDINNGSFILFYIANNGYYYEYYLSNIPVINEYCSETNDIYVPTNPGKKGQVLVSVKEDDGWECEPEWKDIEDILPEGIGGGTTQQIVSASKNKPYNCDIQIDDMWIKYPKNNIQKKCNKNTPPFGFHNLSDIEYFAQNNKNNVYDELVNNCSEPITMDNTYVIIKTKPISLELAEYIRNSDKAFINKNKPLSKHIYLILNFPTKRNLKKNLVSDTTNKTISVKERNKRKDLSHGDGHRSYFNFVHFNNKVFNLPEFSRSSVNSELIQTTNFRISLQDVKTSHHGICWIEKRISLRQLCIALFGNQINNETFSNLRNTFNEFFSLYGNAYQFMNSFPCMQYYYDFNMPYPDKIFYLTNSQTNRTNLTKENIGWNICMYKKQTLVFDPKYRTDFLMTLCGDYMNSGTTGAFKLNNKYLRTTDNVCLAHNAELKNGTSAYNVSRYIYGSDHSVPEFANFTLKALTTAVCEPQFVLVQGTHSYVDGASKLTGADKYEAREDDNAIIHRYSKPNRTISIRLKNTSRFDDRSYSYEYFMSVCSLRITKK